MIVAPSAGPSCHKLSLMSLCLLSGVQLCDTVDCSPPGCYVRGMFQARKLESVTISYQGIFPIPGTESMSPLSPALAGRFFSVESPGKPLMSPLQYNQIFETSSEKSLFQNLITLSLDKNYMKVIIKT